MISPRQPGHSASRFRPWHGAALLAVLVGVAYANTLNAPFIFDDTESILENPHIRSLWPLSEALAAPPQSTVAGRPLVSLSLALNYVIGGLDVRGWHAFNTAVHAMAALALLGVVRRTLLSPALADRFAADATWLAFIVAAAWAAHPLHTAAMTYVIQRAESMMGLFYLLTIYAAARACAGGAAGPPTLESTTGSVDARRSDMRMLWMAAAVLACAAGMATKEVMVTAPVVALLYDRCFFSGSFAAALRRRWPLYAGLAATWVVLATLNWEGPRSRSTGFGLETVTPLAYLRTQCEVVVHYLSLAIWPARLCLDYQWPIAARWVDVWPQAGLLAVLAAATAYGVARNRAWGFCGAWFFLILAPTSSVVPLVDAAFEHRMYLPLASIVALAFAAASAALGRRPQAVMQTVATASPARRPGTIPPVLAAAVIVPLTCRTILRNEDYASTESIWRATLAVRPDNPRAHVNLGADLDARGFVTEAVEHYRAAVASGAFAAHAHSNLGDALRRLGKREEAMHHLKLAILADPRFANARVNMGNALLEAGEVNAAIESYRHATRLRPHDPIAWYNLAAAQAAAGDYDSAIAAASTALSAAGDHDSKLAQAVRRRLEQYRAVQAASSRPAWQPQE